MLEMTDDQVAWLKRVLFGPLAGGVTAKRVPRAPIGGAGAATSPPVDPGFAHNAPQPQPKRSGPLPQGASDRLTGLGFGPIPASARGNGSSPGPAPFHNAPLSQPTQRAQPGAAPNAGQKPNPRTAAELVVDGVKETLAGDGNPLPIDPGAMLAAAVKGSPEGELAGKIAGPLIGGVIAAGATVVADADKVKSGKMTAAAATADVIVEGATGAATALIGAEAGAAAGAALGSIIPGLGTVVGGAVGALVGGVAGYVAGQEAHSSGILDGAKKQIGGALAGAEQPLKAGWGVAAATVHVVEDGIETAKDAACGVAAGLAGAAGDLIGSL